MLRYILRYGTIAGLGVGVPLSVIVLTMHDKSLDNGLAIGYLIMLVALSAIFVAIKRYRDVEQGGVVRFLPALGLGLAISFVAGLFYVLAWDMALAVTHTDFASGYAHAVIEQQKAKGVSGAALAKVVAEMDKFKSDYANPLYRWPMTFIEIFPVGVLVSLISAALLANRRFLPARAVA